MTNLLNIKSKLFEAIFLFIWTLWVIFPMLDSGFIGDDAYNSMILGFLIKTGTPLWEHTFIEINSWAESAGRIWPFQWIYLYGLYGKVTQNLLAIKSFTYLIVFIDVYLFYKILNSLTKSRDLSLLCALIVPLFFQFRWFHDPILSFTFLMPMMFLFMLSSSYLLLDYLDKSKKTSLFLSISIYILALLTYEIAYAAVFIYIAIILLNANTKRGIIFFSIIVLLTALHLLSSRFLINLHIESSGIQTYTGANFNFGFINVIKAFVIQLTAAIPLSWKFADAPFHAKFYKIGLENVVIYALFASFFTKALINFNISSVDKKMLHKGCLFCFFLLTGPSLAMALSGHQQEIINVGFGYAYTPVFIQYFGLSLFFILLLLYLTKAIPINKPFFKRGLFVLLLLLVFLIGGITREENILIVEKSNQTYKYPRVLLGDSFDSGLFNNVTEKDLIIRYQRYPSDYYTFYFLKSGKKLNLCDLNPTSNANIIKRFDKCVKEFDAKKVADGKIYGVTYLLGNEYKNGSVLLAEIDNFVFEGKTPMQFNFKNYKIYTSSNKSISRNLGEENYDFLKFIPLELQTDISKYDLTEFKSDNIAIAYKDFQVREGTQANFWRWTSGSSYILLRNTTKSTKNISIDLDLVRPSSKKGPANISISYNNKSKNFIVEERISASFVVKVRPGTEVVHFYSSSPHIDNGDPRNIVFGIANYKFSY